MLTARKCFCLIGKQVMEQGMLVRGGGEGKKGNEYGYGEE